MKSFFKRLLEHALFTAITLVIFFACVMASIQIWELFEDRAKLLFLVQLPTKYQQTALEIQLQGIVFKRSTNYQK